MTTALNLTLPIKQDAATLQKLAYIKQNFAVSIQPMIDAALQKSEIVHYARVLVIDDKYIQVITEYDGPKEVYAEFFDANCPTCSGRYFRWLTVCQDGASAHWWATPGTGTNVDPRSGAFWPE